MAWLNKSWSNWKRREQVWGARIEPAVDRNKWKRGQFEVKGQGGKAFESQGAMFTLYQHCISCTSPKTLSLPRFKGEYRAATSHCG